MDIKKAIENLNFYNFLKKLKDILNFLAERSGGGGDVTSVNGKTGDVTLVTDDIDDTSSTKKYSSTAEKTKLAGIATGATANDTDANLKNRANHTGTQDFTTISGTASDAQIPN